MTRTELEAALEATRRQRDMAIGKARAQRDQVAALLERRADGRRGVVAADLRAVAVEVGGWA